VVYKISPALELPKFLENRKANWAATA